ncbi:MAG: DNA cytosine methyltransferase [Acidobacteriota bacterium]|nr:DNA cytosine methyltransferase [Acidobacteriota bacterium]
MRNEVRISPVRRLTTIELCAGAGGQALGLELAGFEPLALVELDPNACATLRLNRPDWPVVEDDLKDFDATAFPEPDLLAAGIPCPPFSIAGKQLGKNDERDLFPLLLKRIKECHPRAVMVENVRGLMGTTFAAYRRELRRKLDKLDYHIVKWDLVNASDFGVPQLRPRAILVAFRKDQRVPFTWPSPIKGTPKTVGETLLPLMKAGGWRRAEEWAKKASTVAPTLVGGSKKHGGADLGPTRAKLAWRQLGVDGHGLADHPPTPGFRRSPRLTVEMAALIQGFPVEWKIFGKKTAAYRQVGNAFPPPVAQAFGNAIAQALLHEPDEAVEFPPEQAELDIVNA